MTHSVVLLVNRNAGHGHAGVLLPRVVDRLTRGGAVVDVVAVRDAADTEHLARQAVGRAATTVVAMGGDGSVHLAVQLVAGTATQLGIIPVGTGNDVARALGLPLDDPVRAVDVVLRGHPRRIDLGQAAGRWFAGVLGAGFDSAVNERANRMRWPRGRLRYNVAIVAELRSFRPLPFVLGFDAEGAVQVDAMLVAVCNSPTYGGGMRVSPHARLDDGLLDVVVIHPVPKAEFVRIFPQVYSGRHVRHPAVTVRRVRRVSLAAPGVTAYADGERLASLPIDCEVVPRALSVLVREAAVRRR